MPTNDDHNYYKGDLALDWKHETRGFYNYVPVHRVREKWVSFISLEAPNGKIGNVHFRELLVTGPIL